VIQATPETAKNKEIQGTQVHLNSFTGGHTLRIFRRRKRKESSSIRLCGLNVSLGDWSGLLHSENKTIVEENLFPSGTVKGAIFSRRGIDKKMR